MPFPMLQEGDAAFDAQSPKNKLTLSDEEAARYQQNVPGEIKGVFEDDKTYFLSPEDLEGGRRLTKSHQLIYLGLQPDTTNNTIDVMPGGLVEQARYWIGQEVDFAPVHGNTNWEFVFHYDQGSDSWVLSASHHPHISMKFRVIDNGGIEAIVVNDFPTFRFPGEMGKHGLVFMANVMYFDFLAQNNPGKFDDHYRYGNYHVDASGVVSVSVPKKIDTNDGDQDGRVQFNGFTHLGVGSKADEFDEAMEKRFEQRGSMNNAPGGSNADFFTAW